MSRASSCGCSGKVIVMTSLPLIPQYRMDSPCHGSQAASGFTSWQNHFQEIQRAKRL
jgi:hypothetical protein